MVEVCLPRRQAQVLSLLRLGDSEKQVARKLGISIHTVHEYVKKLLRRFHVSSRAELMAVWASETAWGQRSARMDSAEQHTHPTVADELSMAVQHLGKALDAARRKNLAHSDRETIKAIKILAEAAMTRVEQ